ncbi:MAG: XorII very-short-patch-repair endonuclease [Dehalococcoides mccartyi]
MANGERPKEVVSYTMSRIRSKNTKPEEMVRKYLFSKGLRYRKNDKRYPGCPDIVLPRYHTVVFVNGCFWHMHEGYPCFAMPRTRKEYWEPKLNRNRARDTQNIEKLRSYGWKVIVVWDCELGSRLRDARLTELYEEITSKGS